MHAFGRLCVPLIKIPGCSGQTFSSLCESLNVCSDVQMLQHGSSRNLCSEAGGIQFAMAMLSMQKRYQTHISTLQLNINIFFQHFNIIRTSYLYNSLY